MGRGLIDLKLLLVPKKVARGLSYQLTQVWTRQGRGMRLTTSQQTSHNEVTYFITKIMHVLIFSIIFSLTTLTNQSVV